jgi:hypothetical protein
MLPWLALVVGLILYLYFMVLPLAGARHDNDFRHIYLGARALSARISPYPPQNLFEVAKRSGMGDIALNPYVYLPFTGQVLAPIASLPFRQASQTWFWINHALLAVTVLLTACLINNGRYQRIWAAAAMFSIFALFHPLQRTLTAGQLTLVLTTCTAGVAVLLRNHHPALAGGLAAFATLFKLTPGLLLLPLWFYGGWPAMAGFALTTAVLWGWSIWASGWAIQWEFLPMLRSMGHGRSSWQEYGATFWKDEYNQSFNSLFTHLLVADNGKTTPWIAGPQWLANALSLSLAFGLLAGLAYIHWRDTRHSFTPDQTVLAVWQTTLVALLIPALLWDHYLITLVPSTTYLAFHAIRKQDWITLSLMAIALLIAAVPFNPTSPAYRSGFPVLLMSMKLLAVIIVTAIALVQKPNLPKQVTSTET